jgi:hypothetical protein
MPCEIIKDENGKVMTNEVGEPLGSDAHLQR